MIKEEIRLITHLLPEFIRNMFYPNNCEVRWCLKVLRSMSYTDLEKNAALCILSFCQFQCFCNLIKEEKTKQQQQKNLWSWSHWQKQRQHINASDASQVSEQGTLSVSQSAVVRVLLGQSVRVASYLTVALLCGQPGVCCSASSFNWPALIPQGNGSLSDRNTA